MRKIFFSFHFSRDHWRVAQVRNRWLTHPGNEAQPFLDSAEWQKIASRGDPAITEWIESQMKGASVTVLLIGAQTYTRAWVTHELKRSRELGKGILGVRINRLKDRSGYVDADGPNPLERVTYRGGTGRGFVPEVPFSRAYRTHDYLHEDGYRNMGGWIEEAASRAGR